MANGDSASKLARYESLFQLAGRINSLNDLNQIAATFASGLKYVADIHAWRYLGIEVEGGIENQSGIEEQHNAASGPHGALLLIDGYRGKATVSHRGWHETSAFEQTLRETQKPILLQGSDLTEARDKLPTPFHDPVVAQVYAHPQFVDDTLQGLFLCCSQDKPFDALDLKFVALASLLFHGRLRRVQIERRLVTELEAKLEALHRVRQMEDQLRVQEKMASLGNLVAAVTHEANTPLGAIISSQQTIAKAVEKLRKTLREDTDTARHDARGASIESITSVIESAGQVMGTGAERLNRIVQNLMNFIHLDQAELQRADLRQGLDSVLSLLEGQTEDRITIVRSYEDVSPLYCSPGQLNQVFMHLIDNAIKAIEGKGVIEIKLFEDTDHVHVGIKDSGAGMAPDTVQRLFDFRFSDAGSRIEMGFGLSLDYKIIEQHGGSINVDSAPGKGTEVMIRLPRGRAEASHAT